MKGIYARARMAFLQRCALWSLPRIGVPERVLTYRNQLVVLEKYTRLAVAGDYRKAALDSFLRQDREMYGADWPGLEWAYVIAEYKLKGVWTQDYEGEVFTVTRPAVSPNRVLGLFAATRLGNRWRSRFGAWVMGRRA